MCREDIFFTMLTVFLKIVFVFTGLARNIFLVSKITLDEDMPEYDNDLNFDEWSFIYLESIRFMCLVELVAIFGDPINELAGYVKYLDLHILGT